MDHTVLRRRALGRHIVAGIAALGTSLWMAACGGGGGGGDDVEPPAPPPGGVGTGADGVSIFWYPYDTNVANGALSAVRQTRDAGFVAVGYQITGFSPPQDAYVLKTDAQGARQWQRRIPIGTNAWAHGVAQTADGGYMVVGTVTVAAGDSDAFLLKLDASGTTVPGWPKMYGSTGNDEGYALLAVNGGTDGYVVAGMHSQSGGNVWLLRTDADGAVSWQKSDYVDFCPGGGEFARAVAEAEDGHYVLAGTTGCFGWSGIALKVSSAGGAEIWRQAYDPSTANTARLEAVAAAPDGGFLLAGSIAPVTGSPPVAGTHDALLIKTDSAGQEVWRRIYGGAEQEEGRAVAVAADGDVLLAGYSRSYGGAVTSPDAYLWDDVFTVRLDAAGNTRWQKVKGNRPPRGDSASAMALAADGSFVVAGSSDGTAMLARFDKNGDTVNLGATDFAYTVPLTTGIVGPANAVDVAAAGVRALVGPREVGGTALDLLIDAAQGASPADYCTGGGTYAFSPPVPTAPSAGTSTTLTFADCVIGPSGDQSRLNGSTTISITALSGQLTSASYTVQATLSGIGLQVTEVGGALVNGIAGGMTYLRSAAAGAYSEVSGSISAPAAQTLTFTETGGATHRSAVLGPFTVRSSMQAGGATSIGATIDTISVTSDGHAFAVAVTQPLQRAPAVVEPSSGEFQVTATDGSRVAVGVTNGTASLAVDTDADGIVDATLSVPWETID